MLGTRVCTPRRIDQNGQAALQVAVTPSLDQVAHYCLVRADLPHGMQCAQLVHAAGESSPGNLPVGTYAIALHAKNADHLETISGVLTAQGVSHKRIVEDDGPLSGQLVAIGVVPGPRSLLRRYFSSLPLVK